MIRFDGRVAIVTGAGGNPGLGRGYALLLASLGAKVVVNDIADPVKGASDNANAQAVVDEIRAAGGEAVTAIHSIAEQAGADAVVQTAIDTFGRLDVVINNAGVCLHADLVEMSERDYKFQIDVNTFGTIWMSRAAWPHMLDQGYGRIVNTTSRAAAPGQRRLAGYAAAKGGVLSFTKALALEASEITDADIRVNAISPTAGTRMAVRSLADSKVLDKMLEDFRPELVAPVVTYLSHESCAANGEIICSGEGGAYRLAFYSSKKVTGLDTPDDVAAKFDQIMDLSEAQPLDAPLTAAVEMKPYEA